MKSNFDADSMLRKKSGKRNIEIILVVDYKFVLALTVFCVSTILVMRHALA